MTGTTLYNKWYVYLAYKMLNRTFSIGIAKCDVEFYW